MSVCVRGARWVPVVVLAVIALCASVTGVVFLNPATARAATFQADQLTATGAVYPFNDSTATGGKALTLAATGSAVSYTETTPALSGLSIRARGVNCNGWPVIQVLVDSTVRTTITVSSRTWTDYTANVAIPAGTHTMMVRFSNDFSWLLCDRNVDINTIADIPSAATSTTPTTTTATTPPTTTTPTTTTPTTTTPTTTTPATTTPTTTPPTTTTTAATTTTPTTSGCPTNSYQARYFNNTTASGQPVYQACGWSVGGNFGSGCPATGVNAAGYSIEYVGSLDFPITGPYTFAADTGDMGVAVWLDGAGVMDHSGADNWGRYEQVRTVQAGTHTVRVVVSNTSGTAIENFSVSQATQGTKTSDGRYFAANSFWNTPIPASSTVDSRSTTWINALLTNSAITQISLNQNAWSTPIYRAPAGTPTQAIRITNSNKTVSVPYLSSYAPSPDADSHLVVIDQATGCLYEFQSFSASSRTAIAHASYHAYTGSGGHASGPAHAGGEFSYVAGMITPADVASGVISHALRIAIPQTRGLFAYPGTRSDGTNSAGMPQGTRVRLSPSLNLDALGLTPFQKMVAVAMRDYGAYVADTSSAFSIYAESTIDGSTYSQTLGNLPKSLIGQLQALDSQISSTSVQLDSASDTTCAQQG